MASKSSEEQQEEESAPQLLSDTVSLEDSSSVHGSSPWRQPYDPAPIVPQSTILLLGFLIFLLAMIWPPLILLVAYVASKLIPYSFRINDEAAMRRQLLEDFALDEQHPENFRALSENVQLDERYWTNERYVPFLEGRWEPEFASRVLSVR